jgi:hypothetical protein
METPYTFPGVSIRRFFTPVADQSVIIEDGSVRIEITGLDPLPDGSEYFLTLAATPVKTPGESHQG